MTQNKNKKGIAKKALSISLVAAMLATSNVPVWASGFEAVDPTAEGFAVESAAPETEAVDAAEDVAVAQANDEFDDSTIKVAQNVSWGTAVTVEGALTTSNADYANLKCEIIWKTNGNQASGNGAVQGNISYDGISAVAYTPVYDDFGKALSMEIVVKNADGGTVYDKEFSAGTVAAKDIGSALPAPTFGTVEYTAEEQKIEPSNYKNLTYFDKTVNNGGKDGLDLTYEDFDIVYSTEGNDFTNVTGKDIKVVYTVNEEKAPGYTGTSGEGKYKIEPKDIEADDFVVTLNKTSFEYTGSAVSLSPSDISVVEKKTGKDVTASIINVKPNDTTGKLGKGYKALIYSTKSNIDTNLEATKAVWANYDLTKAVNLTSENGFDIVTRDLSTNTATLNQTYRIGATAQQILTDIGTTAGRITLIGSDGKAINYDKLNQSGLKLELTSAAADAIAAGKPTTVPGGVVLRADGTNAGYVKEVSMDLTLANRLFGDVMLDSDKFDTSKPASAGEATVKVPYVGKTYDLASDPSFKIVDFSGKGDNVTADDYTVTYEPDAINAGVIKMTITGQNSYAGEKKVVYFGITQDEVLTKEVSTEKDLTIDYNNDADASLYADAFGLEIKTELADDTTATLAEGTDYTVEYFYSKENYSNKPIASTAVSKDGENAVDHFVTAKITLTKNGNFKGTLNYISLPLVEKSIENVTIVINPDTYTYTGKEITPTLIVKDGSRYLDADVDYTLKLTNNVNAGTATATIVAKDGSGYKEGSTASKTFNIVPANAEDVTVTFADEYTYTGKQIKPVIEKVELNGVDVTEQFSITKDRLVYGENVNAGKDAGTVTISPKTGNKNFTGTKTATFDIEGIDLTGTIRVFDENGKDITSNIPDYRYTGSAIEFADAEFVPTDKSLDLTEGEDYEFVYINNLYPAGEDNSYLAVIAKGNYVGTLPSIKATDGTEYKNIVAVVKFTITGATFTEDDITVENGIYAGGLPVKPEVTVKVNDYTLTEGVDYELKYDMATDATNGKPYDLEVKGIGAWRDSNNGAAFDLDNSWGIDKRDLSDCDVTVVKGVTTVKIGDVTVDPSNYTVKDNGDGSYTVTAVANHKNLKGYTKVYRPPQTQLH